MFSPARAGSSSCRTWLLPLTLGMLGVIPAQARADDRSDFFEKRIRPVLIDKCGECHAGKTPEGDLSIERLADLTKGGMSGPALAVGKPESSELIKRLETSNKELVMPPEEPLPANVIADFKQWIRDGAVWPESAGPMMDPTAANELPWAFHPLQTVSVPEVKDAAWRRTEIDRFIRAAQESQQLTPVSPADKRTLLRRVTLDLTGLPPTPAEREAFLADESPEAFASVVDRLLASDAYGERWGRHWLDLVRYADTSGDGTDMPVPEARYYRDYVIAAFNRDMPYDQFLVEQLAGDLLAQQTPDDARNHEKIIATGFIALSRRFGNSRNAEYELIVDDTIDTMGRAMLGLTLGCARCHHHKFDPVTSEDYYGLFGYFHSTLYPHAGTEHQKERADFVSLTVPESLKTVYDSPEAWAVRDKPKCAGDVPVYMGGDPRKMGGPAPRAYLSAIDPAKPTIPEGQSGRLELAKWIASPTNPLTPRVVVNRIWQYHFGKGLVATPSNFGKQAEPASHPELLDWLAREFMDHGWSFKHLHRKIVLSAVYQLGSVEQPEQAKLDEANRWYWRFDRQRMDAETLRDSILAVSGTLEPGTGGRHPFPPNDKLKFSQGNPFTAIYDHNHRSVYLMEPRLNKHPFMALYDGPDPNKSTDVRASSTVALQALSMMNGAFLREKSNALAKRLSDAAPAWEARVQLAYELVLNRPAVAAEQTEALQYLDAYQSQLQSEGRTPEEAGDLAWASFARVMLSSNEFVYVD
ncbi:PSD1 and planctomycete cytochrome C domain-containing protein [Planctellipticum variicoloris]|uniref:PSD1 and planctomycete cytochrome C domain-containing protein n=1 Tax=Planctellipticum variicoloris TaxID=3064265 RepID=UPI00301366EA|nr:PSD1 and planctomycete cytochrome C domain-containing protein [Planctomycetaceae bacterium SH412]